MSSEGSELVVTVNGRQAIALGILILIVAGSVISYVIALFAFVSPVEQLRWEATIDDFRYFTGGIQVSFNPGDTIEILGHIDQGDTYWAGGADYYAFSGAPTVRYVVIVYDEDNMPIWFESNTMIAGSSTPEDIPTVKFTLPTDAVPGLYTARGMVWSAWLPSGVSRTLNVYQLTFSVP